MILIADCGSTKIDWCLLNGNEKVAQIFTTGMNALLLTEEEMTKCIHDELLPHIVSYRVDESYYYGAGIISDEIKNNVKGALKANIPTAQRLKLKPICWLRHVHCVVVSLALPASWALALILATMMVRKW